MKKSPTLYSIENNFSRIKRKLGLKIDKSNVDYSNIIFILLYMIVTLVILIFFKPKIVCRKNMPYDDENESKVSYLRFLLFYIILQLPLFIYLFTKSS